MKFGHADGVADGSGFTEHSRIDCSPMGADRFDPAIVLPPPIRWQALPRSKTSSRSCEGDFRRD
jgi:hypothetical protein